MIMDANNTSESGAATLYVIKHAFEHAHIDTGQPSITWGAQKFKRNLAKNCDKWTIFGSARTKFSMRTSIDDNPYCPICSTLEVAVDGMTLYPVQFAYGNCIFLDEVVSKKTGC